MTSLYDFKATTLNGEEQSLGDYYGQVTLVVNTASECGFTPQFAGLEKVYDDYREQGFVVLGFPCNQFGGQEPGDEEAIGAFCQRSYGVSFPMFSKVDVNGPDAHPVFQWLLDKTLCSLQRHEAPGGVAPTQGKGRGGVECKGAS